MKIFRSVRNIPISKVNPLFRNKENEFLTYGDGTSYSYEEELARDYSLLRADDKFSLFLTYEFTPKNMFNLYESHFIDPDYLEDGLLIRGESVNSYDLASYLSTNGHCSCYFELDHFSHILLLENCSLDQLELIGIEVIVNDIIIREELEKVLGTKNLIVPLNRIEEVDNILSKL